MRATRSGDSAHSTNHKPFHATRFRRIPYFQIIKADDSEVSIIDDSTGARLFNRRESLKTTYA